MANTYLQRTPSTNGSFVTNTWSFWVKRTALNYDYRRLWSSYVTSTNNFMIAFTPTDELEFSYFAGVYDFQVKTNRKFRDTSAWYNIVIAQDASASTSTDRVKIYVNGVRETSFATTNFPDLNEGSNTINATNSTTILGQKGNGSEWFEGLMSHVHMIDGTAYDATAFGEYDANGVWKIKTSPSVTYGTNGFFILKDGNSVTDQSGNGNNFTVGGGTLTNTEDNPSNVFATLNPLFPSGNATPFTYSFGNTKISETVGGWQTTTSTLGSSSGKYYAEFKCFGNVMMVGVVDFSTTTRGVYGSNFASNSQVTSFGYGYYNGDGTVRYEGGTELNPFGASYGANDIIGVALDCDNDKLYFSKNGVWQNSGDPTSGATGTGAVSLNTDTNRVWGFALSTEYQVAESNFGNGYFGTTAVSSAGTNASGIGIFEYDVPTGYTALSTKGLNL